MPLSTTTIHRPKGRARLRTVLVAAALMASRGGCANTADDLPDTAANNDAPNNAQNNGVNNDQNNDQNNDANNAGNNDTNNDPPPPNNDQNNDVNNDGPLTCEEIPGCEPGSPQDFDLDAPASVVTVVLMDPDPSVGEDLDNDGIPDNALGGLLEDLSRLLTVLDVNEQYAATIADGRLAFGAIWPTFFADGDLSEGSIDTVVAFLPLADVDGNPDTNALYDVLPEGFYEGSKTPTRIMLGVTEQGSVQVGTDRFVMPFPIGTQTLDVTLERVEMTGQVSLDGVGVAMVDGRMSGIFSVNDLLGTLDDYLRSPECACLGQTEPLLGIDGCLAPAQDDGGQCQGIEAICPALAASCEVLGELLSANADIDTDGDGQDDAISVLLRMELQGTVLRQVQP